VFFLSVVVVGFFLYARAVVVASLMRWRVVKYFLLFSVRATLCRATEVAFQERIRNCIRTDIFYSLSELFVCLFV
jgi:hypothetical protein